MRRLIGKSQAIEIVINESDPKDNGGNYEAISKTPFYVATITLVSPYSGELVSYRYPGAKSAPISHCTVLNGMEKLATLSEIVCAFDFNTHDDCLF